MRVWLHETSYCDAVDPMRVFFYAKVNCYVVGGEGIGVELNNVT